MFYGWYIVAASALIMSYNSLLFIYGFSTFINPIVNTYGWSYAQISLARSVRAIATGAINPFLGALVDRWPARRLLIIGSIILGLGLLSLSWATNLALFYGGFTIMGLGGSLATQLVPQTSVARWFRKNLGKANGIMGFSVALGGVAIPLLVMIIDNFGWKTAYIFAAIGIWVLIIPLSFVFRNRPEEYGMLPDGEKSSEVKDTGSRDDKSSKLSVKETLKTRTFWLIGIGSLAQTSGTVSVLTHMMPHFTNTGMERSYASLIIMMVAMVGLTARIPFGWLMDVISKRNVIALCIALSGTSFILLSFVRADVPFWLIIAYAITFGFGSGGVWLRTALIREYFGTKSIGTILGLMGIFTTVGTSTMPVLTGWVYDTVSDYGPMFLALGIANITGALLTLAIPRYSKPYD
ncbi:MFS transporter [Chloroflexota bacterium]